MSLPFRIADPSSMFFCPFLFLSETHDEEGQQNSVISSASPISCPIILAVRGAPKCDARLLQRNLPCRDRTTFLSQHSPMWSAELAQQEHPGHSQRSTRSRRPTRRETTAACPCGGYRVPFHPSLRSRTLGSNSRKNGHRDFQKIRGFECRKLPKVLQNTCSGALRGFPQPIYQ